MQGGLEVGDALPGGRLLLTLPLMPCCVYGLISILRLVITGFLTAPSLLTPSTHIHTHTFFFFLPKQPTGCYLKCLRTVSCDKRLVVALRWFSPHRSHSPCYVFSFPARQLEQSNGDCGLACAYPPALVRSNVSSRVQYTPDETHGFASNTAERFHRSSTYHRFSQGMTPKH